MPILVSGSLAYDYVMDFPDSFKNHILPKQIHILNVCFMIDRLHKGWGGTGGNICYNLSLLGLQPILLSAIGKDGEEYLEHLKKHHIYTKYIIRDKNRLTSSAYITTDKDDNQITAFYNGPLELGLKHRISNIREKIDIALISPTEKNVMTKHLRECHENGIETVFDPGQQITAFSKEELKAMLKQAKFVIGNDYEIKLLQVRTGWNLKEILQRTQVVITTLGDKGSLIDTRDGDKIKIGICQAKSTDDPTGAGDAYRAGFFGGYSLGYDLKKCGQMGAVAASYAVENYGTQGQKFSKEEFKKRYKHAFQNTLII